MWTISFARVYTGIAYNILRDYILRAGFCVQNSFAEMKFGGKFQVCGGRREAGEARAAVGLLVRPSAHRWEHLTASRDTNSSHPVNSQQPGTAGWAKLQRLLEETAVPPKQSQCLCKAHVSLGLGFCLLYWVKLPWFWWGDGMSVASHLLLRLCAHRQTHSLKCAVTFAAAGKSAPWTLFSHCSPLA